MNKNFRDSGGGAARVEWTIKQGDLVKVTNTTYTGDVTYSHGIVMGPIATEQISMFPFVSVFVFSSGAIENHYPYSLEIISS